MLRQAVLPLLPLSFALTLLAVPCRAVASVLVYEGFLYPTLDAGDSLHQTPVTAIGLQGRYSSTSQQSSSITYVETSLSFGEHFLPSAGGALRLHATGGRNPFTVLNAPLNTGPVTGTVYNSYLVEFQSLSAGVLDQVPALTSHRLVQGTLRLQNIAHQANGDPAAHRPAIGYGSAAHTAAPEEGSLALNTTYLVLARFTDVGSENGVADQFVFTLEGYDSWLSAGASEATLADFAAFATSISNPTPFTFGGSFEFGIAGKGGTETTVLDEVRWGTTLGDVVALQTIPERSSVLLLLGMGIGSCTLMGLRTKRCRAGS